MICIDVRSKIIHTLHISKKCSEKLNFRKVLHETYFLQSRRALDLTYKILQNFVPGGILTINTQSKRWYSRGRVVHHQTSTYVHWISRPLTAQREDCTKAALHHYCSTDREEHAPNTCTGAPLRAHRKRVTPRERLNHLEAHGTCTPGGMWSYRS